MLQVLFLIKIFIYLQSMKTNTLHITNPSKGLVDLARKLQADKEASKKDLREQAHRFFPKKK